jgi:diguanylate cyclase (GGDEF)-like protein
MSERLASLLAPEDALVARWAAAVAAREEVDERTEARFSVAAGDLLAHLRTGSALRCPELDQLSLSELRALREVTHEAVAAAAPVDEVSVLLTRIDTAVDALLSDCVGRQIENLERDALVDPLTGVRNRRALDRDLAAALARARRHQHEITLAMIDLDGLKEVNDHAGHDAGDARLRALAEACADGLREGDEIYRVGGDEFVIVLTYADRSASARYFDRVRPQAPPFSVGTATFPVDGTSAEALLAQADRALRDQRVATRRGAGPASRHSEPPNVPITLSSVTTMLSPDATSVSVALVQGGRDAIGQASGPPVSRAESRLGAIAALRALERLGCASRAEVDAAHLHWVGDHEVVTVVVASTIDGRESFTTGAAVVDRSPADAGARAVVHAVAGAREDAVILL